MLGGLKASTPVPPTITLWSLLVGTDDDVGAADEVDETDEGVAPPVAAAWKAANLSPGLTAKTMPDLQWVDWRQ